MRVLFKRFADIDVDIEVAQNDQTNSSKWWRLLSQRLAVSTSKILRPECFYIEEVLRERMQIPVFHDDQHGTAIIATAVCECFELTGRKSMFAAYLVVLVLRPGVLNLLSLSGFALRI